MTDMFLTVVRLSIAGSLTVLIVLLMDALLRNRLPKTWLFCLYVLAALRLVIPVSFILPAGFPQPPVLTAAAPTESATDYEAAPVGGSSFDLTPATASPPSVTGDHMFSPVRSVPASHPVDITRLLSFVWLTGAVVMLTWSAVGYALTMRKLKRNRVFLKMDKVPVYACAPLSTPILAGLFRPAVYLPRAFGSAELAIQHELCHLRRGDLWCKWFTQLVVCLHWFNPLVYLLKREMNRLSELACDASVVRHMGENERLAYGRMLLETLRSSSGLGGPMIATLGSNKKWLKERMHQIMLKKVLSKKAAIAMTVLTFCVTAVVIVSGAALQGAAADSPVADTPPAAVADIQQSADDEAVGPSVSAASAVKTDTVFVNDPAAIGTWTCMTYVTNSADFDPAAKNYPDMPKGEGGDMIFAENGTMNIPGLTWTKGLLSPSYDSSPVYYSIKTMNDSKYMFLGLAANGQTSSYLVLKWVSGDTAIDITTDDINLPFVDDPAVLGTWNTVDFVRNISDFVPGKKYWQGESYLTQLSFLENGALYGNATQGRISPRFSWTKGAVIDPMYQTVSAYQIKEINGTTYMFFEWKSGDYTYRHMPPCYYVLEKAD